MKIVNLLILSTMLTACIFCARPLKAECTNSQTQFYETSDSVSVSARTKKATFYTILSKDSNTQFGCTVDRRKVITVVIPDDSPLSVVDVQLYTNGRRLKPRRITRGHGMTVVLSPESTQDYKLEFTLVEAIDYSGKLYFLDFDI